MKLKISIILSLITILFLLIGCSKEVAEEDILFDNLEVPEEEEEEEVPQKEEIMIFINNVRLTENQVRELSAAYDNAPVSGSYWYDADSGLYGEWQGKTLGVILTGHEFASLPADASNGNTKVFINGRELNEEDTRTLELLFGVQREPSRWWLDGQGNLGLEGETYVVTNLYLAISQSSSSSSSGGDNFWSNSYLGTGGNEQGGFGYVNTGDTIVCYPGCLN